LDQKNELQQIMVDSKLMFSRDMVNLGHTRAHKSHALFPMYEKNELQQVVMDLPRMLSTRYDEFGLHAHTRSEFSFLNHFELQSQPV
jgi:hypothetical protein